MNLTTLSLTQAAAGLRQRKFTAQELAEAHLQKIEQVEPVLNAFITRSGERALAQAQAVDQRLQAGDVLPPLAGLPVAIKDVLHWQGVRTTAASRMLESYVSPYSATVVERLIAEGSVVVGKTNCDEYAMGASGENSAFGSTKNPWDPTRVPGGSSSGSAAAVAAGEAMFALGTDTGGSVRQPAGFCNLVGLKPTYGRVSRYGLTALASSFDQVGIFTRTVADCAEVLQAIAGVDFRDGTSARLPVEKYSSRLAEDIRGWRLGVPKEYFIDGLQPEVRNSIEEAIELFRSLGCTIQEVSLPHTPDALAVYYLIMTAEASSNLARYDGIRFGVSVREQAQKLTDVYTEARAAGFGAETKRRIMLGTFVLSAGYYDAYYKTALKVRTLIAREYDEVFQQVDALITPTSPTVPFKLGERFQDPLTMYLSDIFTVPANLTGLPAISIPVRPVDSLPVGLQLIGPAFQEARLLQLGAAYQGVTDWHKKEAPKGVGVK